jgi:hypothetical protein
MPTNSPNTLVYIRHGIFSNHTNMSALEATVKGILLGCSIDNTSYSWSDPVLQSGIRLARLVVQAVQKKGSIQKILFIGHSQGGLVCRVAVTALCDPKRLLDVLRARNAVNEPYYNIPIKELAYLQSDIVTLGIKTRMKGIATLATPNAGAFTFGQLAIQAQLAFFAAKKMAALAGWSNFDELTTDKLFRILQETKVDTIKYLSISGSGVNRYSSVSSRSLSQVPGIKHLGLYMELPNDLVVEDSSVDLSKAPMPSEVADLAQQYIHIRSYTNCTDVSHTGIHHHSTVNALLDEHLSRW